MPNHFPLDEPTDTDTFDAAVQSLFAAAIANDIPLDGQRWLIRTDEQRHDWELEIHPVR